MTYVIQYSEFITRKRFSKIPKSDRVRIHRAIVEKLAEHPDIFGKPLRLSLWGSWSLRVGEYRVIYRIEGKTVQVILFGHRSTIYQEAKDILG